MRRILPRVATAAAVAFTVLASEAFAQARERPAERRQPEQQQELNPRLTRALREYGEAYKSGDYQRARRIAGRIDAQIERPAQRVQPEQPRRQAQAVEQARQRADGQRAAEVRRQAMAQREGRLATQQRQLQQPRAPMRRQALAARRAPVARARAAQRWQRAVPPCPRFSGGSRHWAQGAGRACPARSCAWNRRAAQSRPQRNPHRQRQR